MLSLNQSYFQLVTNQSTLVERFSRLEQLVENLSSPSPSRGTVFNNSCRDDSSGINMAWSPQQHQQNQAAAAAMFCSRHDNMTAGGSVQHNNNNAGTCQGFFVLHFIYRSFLMLETGNRRS